MNNATLTEFKPETIGNIYAEIIAKYGSNAFNKPRVGDRYKKMKVPISGIDRPTFHCLPDQILITQPPRLFRSTAWKYKGMVHKDDTPFWEFEYKANGTKDWMSVRLLSYCYNKNLQTSFHL